jgi:hypothetical protein
VSSRGGEGFPDNCLRVVRSRPIKTFLMGGRRHVVVSSYGALVERLLTEQGDAKRFSPNPRSRRERDKARPPHNEPSTQSQMSEHASSSVKGER